MPCSKTWRGTTRTTVYHPTSTCRIGEVVDSKLHVRGVRKLRVADASIMPNVISGNTNAACIMIGEKCAELIAREHGSQAHAGRRQLVVYSGMGG